MFDREGFVNFALAHNVVGFKPEGILLASGRTSHWYVNWRKVSDNVDLIDNLANYIIEYAQDNNINPQAFVGVPEGATKLGIITQYKWAMGNRKIHPILPMIRANKKKHGDVTNRDYIGTPPDNSVLLEDVTTTGDSLFNAVVSMIESGKKGISALTLTDRLEKDSNGRRINDRLSDLDVNFYSMSDARDILTPAYRMLKPGLEVGRLIEKEYEDFGAVPIKLTKL